MKHKFDIPLQLLLTCEGTRVNVFVKNNSFLRETTSNVLYSTLANLSVDDSWNPDDRHLDQSGEGRRYDEKPHRPEGDDRRYEERQHVPSWRADERHYDETARHDEYLRGRKPKVAEERFDRRDIKER